MNKIYVAVASSMLTLAIAWAFLQTHRTEAPQDHSNNIANLQTLNWPLAGIDFRYPATWAVLSWASSSEVISHLKLISSAGGTPKYQPYFCVDLSIDPANTDFYRLRGGNLIANTGNGLYIYQRVLTTGGVEELQAWLTNHELMSVLPLANRKTLFAEVSYRCLGQDAGIPTLNAAQQQSSSYYAEALGILRSVASSASATGD